MTTEAKTQANQANAQSSTGPRTEAGKAISSRNSITHGLTALTVLIPGEDPFVYECFYAGMVDTYKPLNVPETAHIQELTDLQWRLRRASKVEAALFAAEILDSKALNNLGLYTSRMKRHYAITLKEFQQMHRINLEERKKSLAEAEIVVRADFIQQRPSTFAEYGFDFTEEDVLNMIYRAQNLRDNREICQKHEDQMIDVENDESDGDLQAAA